jgi:subtilisin family serine protease
MRSLAPRHLAPPVVSSVVTTLLLVPLVLSAVPAAAAGAPATGAPAARVLVALDDPGALVGRELRTERILPAAVRADLAGRYWSVDVPAEETAEALAARLRTLPGVAAAMVAGTRELFLVPDDPAFATQWHLQPGSAAGIRVAEAWDLQWGDEAVVIAVIDTGVDWSHPDLAANIWINPGEVAGNGIDDDGNGWIDDVRGWDAGNGDADARPETYVELGLDVGFHGTHCAGIAAAVTDNTVGVAGAAPGCRIMPVKVNDSASGITDLAITEAFGYAIASGADVLSMSFGGPGDGGAAAFYQDLVDQALAAGIVCVAAAGNNDDASLMYPAACAGVISVGATDQAGARASYSTYGSWVTVNAPGDRIWSTIQSNYSFDFLTGLLYQFSYGWDGSSPYMYSDGTSMACPMVAGVVGLILSEAPTLGPAEVRQVLLDTGDVVTYDQPLGVKGNAEAAVASLQTVDAAVPVAPALAVQAAPNPFNPRTSLALRMPADGPAHLEIVDLRGRRVRTLLAGERMAAGSHAVTWDGADDSGRALPSGIYLAHLRAAGETTATKLVLAR